MTTKYSISYASSPNKIFYAGDTMRGQVTLHLAKPKSLSRIYLQLKGYAKTSWTTGSGKSRTSYSGKEKYFVVKIEFIPNTGKFQQFEPNKYVFDFSHYLTHNLPSSFESDLGGVKAFIRYTSKLVLVKQWRNQTFKEAFTVLNHYDLNLTPHLRHPSKGELTKNFTFSSKGPIFLRATIPESGYVPGENIPFHLYVKNDSGQAEGDFEIELKLKQIIIASSTYPFSDKRTTKRNVVRTLVPGIPRAEERDFTAFIRIPAIPPTNRVLCSIIQMEYVLGVKLKFFSASSNVKFTMPVVIGTIPFTGPQAVGVTGHTDGAVALVSRDNLPTYKEALGGTVVETPPAEEQPLDDTTLPPPTYEESVFGDVDLENEEHTHFTPRYPVYHYDLLPERPGQRRGSVFKFQKF